MANMLRSLVLAVISAGVASAAVANVCGVAPYISMQQFKDFEPAKAYCAPHFPAQTVTKQLPNRCLTTTSTVILGTSTVTTTSSEACPTFDILQRRQEDDSDHHHLSKEERERLRRRRICQRWRRTREHHEEQAKAYAAISEHSSEEISEHKAWMQRWHHRVERHTELYPFCHLHHALPESTYPVPTDHAKVKRDAGPVPAAKVKRDAWETKSAQWMEYAAGLVNCGYECVQNACSCVAATRTVMQTPAPTCTQTATKSTMVHVTTTVIVSPAECEHGDLRKKSDVS